MKMEITIGEKYGPAMEITDQEEAHKYFEECVQHNMVWNKKEGKILGRKEVESIEKQNLAYYAGYGDSKTRERVERLFCCAHPVFGSIKENGKPTAEEAFRAGVSLGVCHQVLDKIKKEKKL